MSMFDACIDAIVRKSAAVEREGDYKQDGLLYCAICRTPKQCRIRFGGVERVVGCQCACASRVYEAEEQAVLDREARIRANQLRDEGIRDRQARQFIFDNAEDTPLIQKCRRYVEHWPEMLEHNNGLLFWGDVGGGKTFAAACIANALIDSGVPALVTSIPRILNAAWDKREIVDQMRHIPLLVLDDFGVERGSEYALETVYMVVDERYKSGKPLIVTTNLDKSDLENPRSMECRRIYDRILEMCVPVRVERANFRKRRAEDKLRFAREVMQ